MLNTIDCLYKLLLDFTSNITNAGFFLRLERQANMPAMLYCGEAHAVIINRMYARMGATLIKKTDIKINKFDPNVFVDPTELTKHCEEFIKLCFSNPASRDTVSSM